MIASKVIKTQAFHSAVENIVKLHSTTTTAAGVTSTAMFLSATVKPSKDGKTIEVTFIPNPDYDFDNEKPFVGSSL